MTTEPQSHVCQDEDCEGGCPKCNSCTYNNSACGDPECCGPNLNYCTECDWEGWPDHEES